MCTARKESNNTQGIKLPRYECVNESYIQIMCKIQSASKAGIPNLQSVWHVYIFVKLKHLYKERTGIT